MLGKQKTITLMILLLRMNGLWRIIKQIQVASDEDVLVEVGDVEDASKGGVFAPMDDLEVPPIVDNDEGHGKDNINENEDLVEEDDYPAINMKDSLV